MEANGRGASSPTSSPKIAVERAVSDGLEDVVGADFFVAAEIGEGAGDFQDAVVGTGGEIHAIHGGFKKVAGFVCQGGVLFE